MTPKLSVVMPVYNGAAFLREAVDSILNQTFHDFEFLILDDGSDDETPGILRDYERRDGRVRIVWGGRRGLVATLNDGLARARSDIVARMDADDVSHPERLERQYRHLTADSDLWVLGTQWDAIDASGKPVPGRKRYPNSAQEIARALPQYCALCHPTVMMRRDRICKIGGYRAAYQHAEDYDLWLRASESGKIENLDWIGLSFRIGGLNQRWQRQSPVWEISGDLARAAHARRLAGKDDPTETMQEPPPILAPSVLDTLIPETICLYRLVYQMRGGLTGEDAHRLMRVACKLPQIRSRRSLFQRMLVTLLKARSHWDAPMVLGALRALAIHPGKFAKLVLTH